MMRMFNVYTRYGLTMSGLSSLVVQPVPYMFRLGCLIGRDHVDLASFPIHMIPTYRWIRATARRSDETPK